MKVEHPILKFGFHLLLFDDIGQRERPDEAAIGPLNSMS